MHRTTWSVRTNEKWPDEHQMGFVRFSHLSCFASCEWENARFSSFPFDSHAPVQPGWMSWPWHRIDRRISHRHFGLLRFPNISVCFVWLQSNCQNTDFGALAACINDSNFDATQRIKPQLHTRRGNRHLDKRKRPLEQRTNYIFHSFILDAMRHLQSSKNNVEYNIISLVVASLADYIFANQFSFITRGPDYTHRTAAHAHVRLFRPRYVYAFCVQSATYESCRSSARRTHRTFPRKKCSEHKHTNTHPHEGKKWKRVDSNVRASAEQSQLIRKWDRNDIFIIVFLTPSHLCWAWCAHTHSHTSACVRAISSIILFIFHNGTVNVLHFTNNNGNN